MKKFEKFLFILGILFSGTSFTFFLNERTGPINEVFSLKIPFAEIMFLILFFSILYRKKIDGLKNFVIKYSRYIVLVSIYLLSILLSMINSHNKIVVIKDFIQIIFYSIGILFILTSEELDFNFIVKSIFFVSIFHFLVVIISYFFGIRNLPYGLFDHPNQLAVYVAMTLPLMFALEGRFSWWSLVLFFLLGITSLMLTQKRGAIVALLVGISLNFFLKKRFNLTSFVLILFVVIFGILGLEKRFGVGKAKVLNYFSLNQLKIERSALWVKSFELFKKSPLVGVGSSNFPLYFEDVESHNLFLKLLSETGILGLVSFFTFFIYILIHSLKSHFIFSSLISIFIFSMFNPAPFFIRGVGCISWVLANCVLFLNNKLNYK